MTAFTAFTGFIGFGIICFNRAWVTGNGLIRLIPGTAFLLVKEEAIRRELEPLAAVLSACDSQGVYS